LAGNPNSGKTSIFNALTGARQHVGSYPGVTVERKEGLCRHNDVELRIVDLPGTYSLTAYSPEELVARNFIINEKPDVVVDILDASNLERNLYLAVQLMELGVPLVLFFNMSDMAKSRGYAFDLEKLARRFRARIVQTVEHRGVVMKELLDAVVSTATYEIWQPNEYWEDLPTNPLSSKASIRPYRRPPAIKYGRELEEEVGKIESLIKKNASSAGKYDARWLAVKLLENDRALRETVSSSEVNTQIEESASRIEKMLGEHPETAIAGSRYGFISAACQEAVRSTIGIRTRFRGLGPSSGLEGSHFWRMC
jgi:ferrous iron transport protein B